VKLQFFPSCRNVDLSGRTQGAIGVIRRVFDTHFLSYFRRLPVEGGKAQLRLGVDGHALGTHSKAG
jgi:hypothetical protein